MVDKPASVAVVVPMYNEEAGAYESIMEVTKSLAELDPMPILVVVNDGSRDATEQKILEARTAGCVFEYVSDGINRGYGAALRQGAVRAKELGADWVLFMDSDLTNPPSQIGEFVSRAGDTVDFVKACRYVPGGSTGDVPLKRVVISRTGNLVARYLTGIRHRDLTNGFRLMRIEPYLAMPLTERGFAVIVEEMYWAKRMGLRGCELPSVLRDRAPHLRPTSFRYTRAQLWSYFRWPLRTFLYRVGLRGF